MNKSSLLPFETLYNTRDLGGMEAADGRRIRAGRLIRSGSLYFASAGDQEKLAKLLSLVVDFRTEDERAEKPNPVLEGVPDLHIPVLERLTPGVTRERNVEKKALEAMKGDPETAAKFMEGTYANFVKSDFSLAGYERFLHLLEEERPGALLWQCSVGKDRTGFAAVLVEELLGVDREAIREDYLATGEYLRPRTMMLVERRFRELGHADERAEQVMFALFGVR